MKAAAIVCKDPRRRQAIYAKPGLYGLDYVEVGTDEESGRPTLAVVLLGKAPALWQELSGDQLRRYFRIDGGRRIRGLEVAEAILYAGEDAEQDDWLELRLDRRGDFSSYTLSVQALDEYGQASGAPYPGFDPRYAGVAFSFLADCPSDLDCRPAPPCPPAPPQEPAISYLAKDYASFRQLLFDRLALLMPDWREQHVPDVGVTLVELLAYSGDQLSYYQDAVATEAYLATARRRVSVRRHARLVDYTLHEGCNARAWVHLWVSQDLKLVPEDFYCITQPSPTAGGNLLEHSELPGVLPRPYTVFEPLVEDRQAPIALWQAHNEIAIYSWGDAQCCLPQGATSATLQDAGKTQAAAPAAWSRLTPQALENKPGLRLQAGDVLLFEEVKGPKTGAAADADPRHRHAVRLIDVLYGSDPLDGQCLAEVHWSREDALPFPLCISSLDRDCRLLENVSVARGNLILTDHGERFAAPLAEAVPAPAPIVADCHAPCACGCSGGPAGAAPQPPYRPALPGADFSVSQALPPSPAAHSGEDRCSPCGAVGGFAPASALLQQDPRLALPQVELYGYPCLADGTPAFGPSDVFAPSALAQELREQSSARSRFLRARLAPASLQRLDEPSVLQQALSQLRQRWQARRDLLGSGPDDCHFVVELEDDRRASARFGDDDLGRKPAAGYAFWTEYRTGNGPPGNIGAESLGYLVFRNNRPNGVQIRPRNPFPASGGTQPEPITEAKLFAPQTFRKDLQRAITADDYAAIVLRDFPQRVQRAAASLGWTGNSCEVLVAIDPWGSETADAQLLCTIRQHLERYRRIGHDLVVGGARYVPLSLKLHICVQPGYLRAQVKAELLQILGNGVLPDGRRGFFHPDNLSFGAGIYLSQLAAAAQQASGVECVQVQTLERLYQGPNGEIENGLLPLGPLEIAQVDNDPSFPEHGVLVLDVRGGR